MSTTLDTLPMPCTISQLLDVLSEALHDPHKPTRCSDSLWALLFVVSLPEANIFEDATIDVQTRNRFHKALYSFLVAERTKHQLMNEMDRFKDCEKICKLDRLHDRKWADRCITIFLHGSSVNHSRSAKAAWPLYYFPAYLLAQNKPPTPFDTTVSGFMTSAITLLERLWGRRSFNSLIHGQSKEWPKKVSHLVPYGADSLVSSLLQWYDAHPDGLILSLITQIAARVRFSIHESMARQKFMPIILDSTKDAAVLFMNLAEKVPKLGYSHLHLNGCLRILRQLREFCLTIYTLFQEFYVPERIKMALMGGCAAKAVQLATLTHCIYPLVGDIQRSHQCTPEENVITGMKLMSTVCGAFIYHKFGIASAVSQSLVADIQQAEPVIMEINHAHWTYARTRQRKEDATEYEGELGLVDVWREGLATGCSSPSCTNTNIFLDDEHKIKTCSGCLSVYYCSKECERADWNDAKFPHKSICPLIQKIIDACVRLDHSERATRSSKYLRSGLDQGDGRAAIQDKIQMGKLNASEEALIKGWGQVIYKRIYPEIPVDIDKWNPGYADYDDLLNRLPPHLTFRTYESTESRLFS